MIFLGPREKKSGKFTLKNFHTEEQFKDLDFDDMVEKIRSYLESEAQEYLK